MSKLKTQVTGSHSFVNCCKRQASKSNLQGDRLYLGIFKKPDKWVPATITPLIGPVSYQVQITSSTIQHQDIDHFPYHYPLNNDDQESNDFDD